MFVVASKLGLTSFGGPIAHFGYFRREYVERRHWLDEETYAEIVALCQFLPGPTSSEVGMAIGLLRAGPLGAFLAWLGFTLPSVVAMVAFAYTVERFGSELTALIRVLQLVALGVVALAVWRMARALAWDVRRGTIALVSAAVVLASPSSVIQVAVIASGALAGWRFVPAPAFIAKAHIAVPIGRRVAAIGLAAFLVLLVALPLGRLATTSTEVRLFDTFYRSSALVFGGGHVVLPLLHAEVVPAGWVSEDRFLAGYGAAQVMPGPLFTFASYLGAAIDGIAGAVVATIAVFLPGFLLVFAALPSWGALRTRTWAVSALRGVNAAVVGLLLAALIGLARTAIASLLT